MNRFASGSDASTKKRRYWLLSPKPVALPPPLLGTTIAQLANRRRDPTPINTLFAAYTKNGRPINAAIAGEKGIQRGPAQKEVQPMEETTPFPQESSKPLEEETAEFLELLLRIGFELEEPAAE